MSKPYPLLVGYTVLDAEPECNKGYNGCIEWRQSIGQSEGANALLSEDKASFKLNCQRLNQPNRQVKQYCKGSNSQRGVAISSIKSN